MIRNILQLLQSFISTFEVTLRTKWNTGNGNEYVGTYKTTFNQQTCAFRFRFN